MIRYSTGLRNAIAGTIGFAGALANGIIEIRTGSQPASADAAPTGTLLGTLTTSSGAFTPGSPTNGLTFTAASGGGIEKSGIWSLVGVAAGTAGWFRFKGNAADDDSLSTTLVRMDGSCAVSGGNLAITSIAFAIGKTVTADGFSWAYPAQGLE